MLPGRGCCRAGGAPLTVQRLRAQRSVPGPRRRVREGEEPRQGGASCLQLGAIIIPPHRACTAATWPRALERVQASSTAEKHQVVVLLLSV